MNDQDMQSPDIVLFQGDVDLAPGEVDLQKFKGRMFGRKLPEVKADFSKVSLQVNEVVASFLAQAPTGFSLDEIKIELGFSAKGQLVFIAEAGIETSVTVTYKRKP